MTIGVTKKELETRSNDSLIKYIGVLQTELQMLYNGQLSPSDLAIKKGLDLSCPDTLKSK